MDYFIRLQELLKLEREEDRRSYEQMTASTTVQQRRANGLSWYPVAIRGTEMSRGEYITVELERTTHRELSHQLRFGVSAMLFSNHDPEHAKVEGLITFQAGNLLKLTLRTDELPEWSGDGKLGVDLLFDDNSYGEMLFALKLAPTIREKKDEGRLIRILLGEQQPDFNRSLPEYKSGHLNESQRAAVNNILQARDLAIVHGPPGTGKTTTIVEAIKVMIIQEKQQILVVAPSNAAVDLLSEKLSDAGLYVLRVGNPARVSPKQMMLTLDSRMGEHNTMKEIRRLKNKAAEYKNLAHKYKRNFGKAEREQRKALFDEAHRIMKDVGNMEQYIIDDLVAKADVITATLVGSNHYTVRKLRYKTVVIDEAGQALEPAAWIAALKGSKLVMAGDHYQLPPTIKSAEAAKQGLASTLLEKAVALHPDTVSLLEEQYRMNTQIMEYSSRVFYNNRLKAHHSVASHTLFDGDKPFLFIDTAGCGFEEEREGTSSTNPEEASFLIRHLSSLSDELIQRNINPFPSAAIIAPYKEQTYLITEQLEQNASLMPYRDRIAVNTVDSFQGQERDIIYISLTRSNPDGIIGFLSDIRRMNVAMTRARKKLVMIGDSATLSRFPFYAELISYAEEQGAYHSAWEFMDV